MAQGTGYGIVSESVNTGFDLFRLAGHLEPTAFTLNLFNRVTSTEPKSYVDHTEIMESYQTQKPANHHRQLTLPFGQCIAPLGCGDRYSSGKYPDKEPLPYLLMDCTSKRPHGYSFLWTSC
jgi:hypothetical protein